MIARSGSGTAIEPDWSKAPEGLLPILGSLGPHLAGKIALLVEGQDDREYLATLSEACRKASKVSLPSSIHPLPGGGSQLPQLAHALHSIGIRFLLLVDGDASGKTIAEQVVQLCATDPGCVISTADVVTDRSISEIEDLFSSEFKNSKPAQDQGLRQAARMAADGRLEFDEATLKSFEDLFVIIQDRTSHVYEG